MSTDRPHGEAADTATPEHMIETDRAVQTIYPNESHERERGPGGALTLIAYTLAGGAVLFLGRALFRG